MVRIAQDQSSEYGYLLPGNSEKQMKGKIDLGSKILALMSVALLLIAQMIWFMPLRPEAETAGDELVVRVQYYGELGDKIREKARFSRSELETMGAETWYYSNITRVGTVMSMAAYGPEVLTIIEEAGIDPGSIGNITFRTTDGYTRNFTVDRHLKADKYYYPNLSSLYERNDDGNALTPLEGALEGKEKVPAILALEFGESKKPGVFAEDLEMGTDRTYRFCMGQGNLTEGKMTDSNDGGGDITSMESCHSIYGIDVTLTGSPIKGMTLDIDDTTIKVGSMKRVSAYLDVDEAFEGTFAAEDLKWSSSDESIATVNSRGEVTVHSEGSVTITAVAPDGTTAQIVINGAGDEEKEDETEVSGSDNGESRKDETAKARQESPVRQSGQDSSPVNTDKDRKNGNTKNEDKSKVVRSGSEVRVQAREIVLGDMIVEEASPQDEMRGKMADDAVALDEARTYSRGAAAGTAAGSGMLCGAGAIGRIIRYRRDFGRPRWK